MTSCVKVHSFDFENNEVSFSFNGWKNHDVDYYHTDLERNTTVDSKFADSKFGLTNLITDKPIAEQVLDGYTAKSFQELFDGSLSVANRSDILNGISRFLNSDDVKNYLMAQASISSSTKYTRIRYNNLDKFIANFFGSLKQCTASNLELGPDDVVVFTFTFKSHPHVCHNARKVAYYCKVRGEPSSSVSSSSSSSFSSN